MAEAKKGGNLSLAEEHAFQLSRCAIALDQARQNREKKPAELTSALNENLQVWVAIRTLSMREDSGFSDDVKDNLIKLSKFVAEKVFDSPEGISDQTMDTLINVNLQISEGLLEGVSTS